MPSLQPVRLFLALFLASLAAAQAPIPCQPQWLPTFGSLPPHLEALAVADAGNGPTLFGSGPLNESVLYGDYAVGRWNGRAWVRIPGLFNARVAAIASWDDGSGARLFVAGSFTSVDGMTAGGIAKWTGSAWDTLGGGVDGSVDAMTVYDDGSGSALYVAGFFSIAGSIPASCVAKWDGTNWSALGAGTDGTWPDSPEVLSLSVYDDGSGSALYAGGLFTHAGGQAAARIARWDGSNWSAVGTGLGLDCIWTLAVFDDGSGAALYAGGPLTGGSYQDQVAKWNGSNWNSVGSSFYFQYPFAPILRTLLAYDDGSGSHLYAGGQFTGQGGGSPYGLARWNGASWVGCGIAPSVGCAAVFDDGSGSKLWVSSKLEGAGHPDLGGVTCWNGSAWTSPASAPNGAVTLLASADLGSGRELYVGGNFVHVGDITANLIARWDGAQWFGLDTGLQNPGGAYTSVSALKEFDDGGGPMLYVSGGFQTAGPVTSPMLARWSGTQWLSSPAGIPPVLPAAMEVFDDGGGPALFIAGGPSSLSKVCKMTGSAWASLGSSTTGEIHALRVFDAGTGAALYAGGSFVSINGVHASCIAKWDGTQWTSIGDIGGIPGSIGVGAMAVCDDGSGPALFVGGAFTSAGGVPVQGLAKWDGQTWSDVGGGVSVLNGVAGVGSMTAFDDGRGPGLVVGGYFDHAGSTIADGLARWDGSGWSALGPYRRAPFALAVHDDGSGPALFTGGDFGPSFDGERYLAKWGNPAGCGAPGMSVCEPGVGGVSACPCGNPPAGLDRGCDNSSFSGGAQLNASGIARLAFDSVVFTTRGEKPSATSLVLQGDNLSAPGFVFGQGVRCVTGTLKRLYVKTAVAGSISVPAQTDAHVHTRSAALGDTIAPGAHRYYGVYYRDPNVLGGCAATSTFNVTQQLDVLWAP